MAGQEKWYFTREQLKNSPSRKCGLDGDKELAYRQQAANLIQDMGQRLQVSQLCINTAIVYMHRFYAFHSFTQFHRNAMAAAALFLAAKVEEQPRKLEYVIKVAHVCVHRGESGASLDPRSDHYQEQAQDLVFNENVLLQTLGFDVAIDHPHTHVVRTCHLVKAPKDLAQTSYFMASNSLHLTTMCLQYHPTVVACFCIHLASKWSHWAIPQSNEGRHWFQYVDRSVTTELLEKLTAEFLHIFDKCPSRLKRKMMSISSSSSSPHSSVGPGGVTHQQQPVANSPFDPKKTHITDDMEKSFDKEYEREKRRAVSQAGGYVPAGTSSAPPAKMDFREYREKKEREERERRQAAAARAPPRPAPPHRAPPPHKWPHHKQPPPNHHHRPPPSVPQPGGPISASGSSSSTNNANAARARPPSLFSPESTSSAPRRPPSSNVPPNVNVPSAVSTAPNVVRRPPAPIVSSQTQIQPPQVQPSSASSANVNTVPAVLPPQVPSQSVPVQQQPQQQQQHRKRDVPPVIPSSQPPVGVARDLAPPPPVSPFASPPPASTPKRPVRPRTSSSSSEPELIPVVKKLDETPGFENIIRDSQRHSGIRVKQPTQPAAPNITSPQRQSLNGIETDPAMVSNLLKESLFQTTPVPEAPPVLVEAPPPVPEPAPPPVAPIVTPAPSADDHHHRSEKKKKKEKHKHKDRDKPRDERKKHKKDKDKEKKKEKLESVPAPVHVLPPPIENEQNQVVAGGLPGGLKITIPRDKLASSPGLKIKIPKERLASTPSVPPPLHIQPALHQAPGLKIKIPKEVLDGSRKRSGPMEPHSIPAKLPRHNGVPHHHHKVGFSGIRRPAHPQWQPPYFYHPPAFPPPPMFYPPPDMFAHSYYPPQPLFAQAPMGPVRGEGPPPLPSVPPPTIPPPPPD